MDRIELSDSAVDIMVKMSEGNPGAITVLMQLMKEPIGLMDVLTLDDMGIRGSQIWVGYKDYCKQDIVKFKEAIKVRDTAMIAVINAECPGKKAIAHGASW